MFYTSLSDAERDKLKTERQWLRKGFVPLCPDAGTVMYSNHFCNGQYRYLTAEEVRPATDAELAPYRNAQREKQHARRQRAARQKKLLALCAQQRAVDTAAYEQVVPYRTAVIDVETTGLEFDAEILQVSVLDADSDQCLFDSLVRPYYTTAWPEAMKVNHITPEMVSTAPYFHQILPSLNRVLAECKTVVGYNFIDFDRYYLERFGAVFKGEQVVDVMLMFAAVYGEYCSAHHSFKYKRLSFCADYFGYDWGTDQAHNSLPDCRATAHCYRRIMDDKYQTLYRDHLQMLENGLYE